MNCFHRRKWRNRLFCCSEFVICSLVSVYYKYKTYILNSTEFFLSSFFLTIFVYILTSLIPLKLKEEISKLYPEYKLHLKASYFFNVFVPITPHNIPKKIRSTINSAIPSTPYYHAMMATLLKEPFRRLSGGHDVSFSCRLLHRYLYF